MASVPAGVPRKNVRPVLCWLGRAVFTRRRVPAVPRGSVHRVFLDRWRARDRHVSSTCQSDSDSTRQPGVVALDGKAPAGFHGQKLWNARLPVRTARHVTHRDTPSLADGTGSQVCLYTGSLTRTDPSSAFTLSHTEILVSCTYGTGGDRLVNRAKSWLTLHYQVLKWNGCNLWYLYGFVASEVYL